MNANPHFRYYTALVLILILALLLRVQAPTTGASEQAAPGGSPAPRTTATLNTSQ